jgi:hypothetical protein
VTVEKTRRDHNATATADCELRFLTQLDISEVT